jgi:hypothetical protein
MRGGGRRASTTVMLLMRKSFKQLHRSLILSLSVFAGTRLTLVLVKIFRRHKRQQGRR